MSASDVDDDARLESLVDLLAWIGLQAAISCILDSLDVADLSSVVDWLGSSESRVRFFGSCDSDPSSDTDAAVASDEFVSSALA